MTHDAYQQKRVLCLLQDIFLGQGVCHLILPDDHLLLQDLDGIQMVSRFLSTQDHFAKSALSQHFQELKILECLL